jgi:hypothetical protein
MLNAHIAASIPVCAALNDIPLHVTLLGALAGNNAANVEEQHSMQPCSVALSHGSFFCLNIWKDCRHLFTIT